MLCKRLKGTCFNQGLRKLCWVANVLLKEHLHGGLCFCSLGCLHWRSVTSQSHKLNVWCSELRSGASMWRRNSLHLLYAGSERSSYWPQLGGADDEEEPAFCCLVLPVNFRLLEVLHNLLLYYFWSFFEFSFLCFFFFVYANCLSAVGLLFPIKKPKTI